MFDSLAGGDYGDGSPSDGSVRLAFIMFLNNVHLNSFAYGFLQKASFLLGIKQDTPVISSPSFCVELADEGRGSLLFDFKAGHVARLSDITLNTLSRSNINIAIYGIPADIDEFTENRILLANHTFSDPTSTNFSIDVSAIHEKPINDVTNDQHSCKFDSRPALESVLLELIAVQSYDDSPLCIENIEINGEISPAEMGSTCIG